MQKLFIIAVSTLALALARPADDNNQRQTDVNVDGGVLDLKHRGTIWTDGNHEVTGLASFNKNLLDKKDPAKIYGQVNYNHLNSGNGLGINAENRGPYGTKVGAEATYNVFKDRFNKFDVGVNYEQKFGGLGGRSEPNFGAFGRITF